MGYVIVAAVAFVVGGVVGYLLAPKEVHVCQELVTDMDNQEEWREYLPLDAEADPYVQAWGELDQQSFEGMRRNMPR